MIKKVVGTLAFILLLPAALILLSGDPYWIEGWLFSLWFIGLCYVTIIYLYRRNPGLLEERYRRPGTGNQKGWDVYVVAGLMVGFVSWMVVMSVDAKRYAWSPVFPIWLEALGGIMLLGSGYLFFRSYADNPYLSALVRVQEDRKQKVVSTGVYGFVRHPMYLGATLMLFGAPVLLGSAYGLLVGGAMVLLLAARIRGEEAMLVEELDGYREYEKKVRYRLIPGIW